MIDVWVVWRIAFAVTGQVNDDDCMLSQQIWRYVTPHETGLRKSVEQEYRVTPA